MRAFAVALLCVPTIAAATPVSVGANTGIVGDFTDLRAAGSIDLQVGATFPGDRLGILARVDGWTFANAGSAIAQSEASTGVELYWSQPVAPAIFVIGAAGPAAVFENRPGRTLVTQAAAMINPSVLFATRRRSLAFQIGAQAIFFADGVRVSGMTGVVYTFW